MPLLLRAGVMATMWIKVGDVQFGGNKLYAEMTGLMFLSVYIFVLERLYEHIAEKLANWENHRTQTGVRLPLSSQPNFASGRIITEFVREKLLGCGNSLISCMVAHVRCWVWHLCYIAAQSTTIAASQKLSSLTRRIISLRCFSSRFSKAVSFQSRS